MSRIEWWTTLTMGFVFFNYSDKETEFFPVFKNGIFQQFSRSAVFSTSLYKKLYMVKVVHHSILNKIKSARFAGTFLLRSSLASLSAPRARDSIVALRARSCALCIRLSLFLIIWYWSSNQFNDIKDDVN